MSTLAPGPSSEPSSEPSSAPSSGPSSGPRLTLPASAPTLADAVAGAVRDGVRAGELVPEHTYSVYQLAELLGVSRSPVREALLRLAEAGLVEIARNRGFRVLVPQAHDVEEIFEVRLALEPPAVARVAADGSAAVHARVAARLADLRAACDHDDHDAFWPADHALHDTILRAAGNARVARIVADLRATTALLGPPTTATGRTLRQILAEHTPVVDAVLARDPAAAEAAMRDHLLETGRLVAAGLGAGLGGDRADGREPEPGGASSAPRVTADR